MKLEIQHHKVRALCIVFADLIIPLENSHPINSGGK